MWQTLLPCYLSPDCPPATGSAASTLPPVQSISMRPRCAPQGATFCHSFCPSVRVLLPGVASPSASMPTVSHVFSIVRLLQTLLWDACDRPPGHLLSLFPEHCVRCSSVVGHLHILSVRITWDQEFPTGGVSLSSIFTASSPNIRIGRAARIPVEGRREVMERIRM